MKIKLVITSSIVAVVVLFLLLKLAFFALTIPTGATVSDAKKLIAEEGLERINKDAEAVFRFYGTNISSAPGTIQQTEMTNLPVISHLVSKLGSYADAWVERVKSTPFIVVRFGSHFHAKFLYISDPRESLADSKTEGLFSASKVEDKSGNLTEISSNMFITEDSKVY